MEIYATPSYAASLKSRTPIPIIFTTVFPRVAILKELGLLKLAEKLNLLSLAENVPG